MFHSESNLAWCDLMAHVTQTGSHISFIKNKQFLMADVNQLSFLKADY